MRIEFSDLNRILADLRDQLQREANQSIRQRDNVRGLLCLGGLDALDRLKQRLDIFEVGEFAGRAEAVPFLPRKIRR